MNTNNNTNIQRVEIENRIEYTFKRITTGETVVLKFYHRNTLAEFISVLNDELKRRYNIDEYNLIEGGTVNGENGQVFDFRNVPTRVTTIFQFFGNINAFYISV